MHVALRIRDTLAPGDQFSLRLEALPPVDSDTNKATKDILLTVRPLLQHAYLHCVPYVMNIEDCVHVQVENPPTLPEDTITIDDIGLSLDPAHESGIEIASGQKVWVPFYVSIPPGKKVYMEVGLSRSFSS